MNEEQAEGIPVQPLLGLVLGAVSSVMYPPLYVLLFLIWIIPAAIAGVLSISPRTSSLAVGFGAASVGWLFYYAAFYIFGMVAAALQ